MIGAKRRGHNNEKRKKKVLWSCFYMHTLLWAVQLYTTVLIRCTSQAPNRASFNRTGPSFSTQCSCSPLYSWPIQHVCQNTLWGIVEPETTNRPFPATEECFADTVDGHHTLWFSLFFYLNYRTPYTLWTNIDSITNIARNIENRKNLQNKPTLATPLSFNLFSSLYPSLSHFLPSIKYSTLPCDPSLILMNLWHAHFSMRSDDWYGETPLLNEWLIDETNPHDLAAA